MQCGFESRPGHLTAILVRPARVDDAEGIARVHVDSWREGYAGLVAEELLRALDVEARAAAWREIIPDATVLVAERAGEIAGFTSVAIPAPGLDERGVGEVTALYVRPHHWRHGVGRALGDAAAAELRDEGCDAAVLWAFEGNARGRAFYAALGFVPDGARTEHDRTGLAEIRLRARLD
jgi:GNAT superfamily N-acetyltransferase